MAAIVGIGLRLPGEPDNVTTPAQFVDFVADKKSGIKPLPTGRFPPVWEATVADMRFGALAGDSVWDCDGAAFGFSPVSMAHADPQLRLALEVCIEALHDSGLTPADVQSGAASVGVFAAGGLPEHIARLASGRGAFCKHTIVGNYGCYLSNFVSQIMNLKGPSLTLDTACSSSLTALHVAMESLACGSCDAALVLGTNALLSPHFLRALGERGALSIAGNSVPFDAAADGFVRGEGAVAIVLVPNGRGGGTGAAPGGWRGASRVYADVLVTGINHDGFKASPGVPSAEAQNRLIARTLARVGVDPAHVAVMEAHATGTPTGDPIEASAVGASLGAVPGRERPLLISSVKGNFGHLESAAGLVSLAKVALGLYHGVALPMRFSGNVNRRIKLDRLNLELVTRLMPLEPAPGA